MSPTTPLSLDRECGQPLYRQIEDQLRGAIRERRLRPGTRVPSIRSLARELGVSRLTVVTAYEELAAEGYLVGRVGFGTVVASGPEAAVPPQRVSSVVSGATTRRLPTMRRVVPREPIGAPTPDRAMAGGFDFRLGAVALELFPSRTWERLLHEVWTDLEGSPVRSDVDYPDPAGDPELRAVLAAHLAETRAVTADARRVVVTSGTPAALASIAALWLEPGRVAVVEEPCSPHLRRALALNGATVVGVPVDERGLIPDALPNEASLVVVTPSWQYPAGGTLPLARRTRLLTWAAEVGAIVVEDDRESDIRYGTNPLAAIQSLDGDGRVIHIASFSRVLYPGLRTGCVVLPERFVERYTAALEVFDRGPAVLEQRALARFIAGGHLGRHLGRLRVVLAERQAAMLGAVERELGSILSVQPAPAGLHLIAHIEDDRWTASRIVELGRSSGVLIEALPPSASATRPNGDPTTAASGPTAALAADRRLVLQYARHDPAAIAVGIARLADALEAEGPCCDSDTGPVASTRGALDRTGRRVAQP
ncbi:MAG TPA: PLP-dependent aminotransferase family protein [Candidatus Binatia bacterium]|nr:PLP-dependent aminotransferase family protein [Candidatus Binatia bacterium]